MAFSARRKLAEIELKIDRILEMLGSQAQTASERDDDTRQFLRTLLDQKAESLANENQRKILALEEKLKDMESEIKDIESKLSVLTQKSAEEIRDLCKDMEKRGDTLEKALKAMKQDAEKQQKAGQVFAEKLDLTENEIRMLLINSVMDQIPSCEDENRKA